MRARYLAISKHLDAAIAAYQEALALDPESSMIQRELAVAQSQAR
jgi:predicted TPR repeat methyltransferase